MGVFASTVQAPRPLNEIDPELEKRFIVAAQRMFFLNYASNLMRGEPGTKPEESFAKADRYKAECEKILAEMEPVKSRSSGDVRVPLAFHTEAASSCRYAACRRAGTSARASGNAPAVAAPATARLPLLQRLPLLPPPPIADGIAAVIRMSRSPTRYSTRACGSMAPTLI